MGRPPTRQLTWEFVLRTFDRMRMIQRLDQKWLAEQLAADPAKARRANVRGLYEWLGDVNEDMRKLGYDSNTAGRRHDKCAVCDKEIMLDHNGARYCSIKCRQRAYRVRKAAAEGRNSPIPKRSRTRTIALAGGVYELHLKRPRRRKKGSVVAQGDTSTSASSETNVTQTDGPR